MLPERFIEKILKLAQDRRQLRQAARMARCKSNFIHIVCTQEHA